MKLFLSLISLSILVVSCGVYSFTGASIPTEAKTISVQYISNKAAIVQPSLSQVITDGLIDAFARQTNLEITENLCDLWQVLNRPVSILIVNMSLIVPAV